LQISDAASAHRKSLIFPRLKRFNIPNTTLHPELVLSVDFGLEWSALRFRAEAFGFHSRFEDKLTAVPTEEFTPEGRQVVCGKNLNSVKFWGAEAVARFHVTEHWNLSVSFTYTCAEEKFRDDETASADRVTATNGGVGAFYQASGLGGSWWKGWAEGVLRFASDQDRLNEKDRRDARLNPYGTPSG